MSEEMMAKAFFRIFAQKGYASTSLSDLTQATGMKPASLYLAFGNKEGMYAAALNYYRQTWLTELQQILDDKMLSFEQRMRAFLQTAFSIFSCDDKPLGCMMTFSALAFQTTENAFARQLYDERRAFTLWLEQEARDAKATGQLHGELMPAEFAQLVITLERGLALGALDRPNPETIQSMIDKVLALLFAQPR